MKTVLLLSSAITMLLAVSCGGRHNAGPKTVADKFAYAYFVEMDIDVARRYISPALQEEFPETAEMNDIERQFIGILQDHAKARGYAVEYDAERSKIDDGIAEIYYKLTAGSNPEWTGTGMVELTKDTDAGWIVTDCEFDRDDRDLDFGF